ncbi:DUF3461 family protein [Alginatibacterium sediminis]|uniref:DUF3461 family protein n=1 Tax=Alginatibacterium sediminis TaxID=2164068 RepID=A0A420E7R6_9ALTE|nr:DUF3461 family protein [Alginatibacterium sediminis]RKF15516.1 DUF3461 family protein [Alginatibacterium sediminis]
MYPNLQNIGISNPTDIESYKLRQEVNNDILKVYFHKHPGELFAKSVKFKFPRQHKKVAADRGTQEFRTISEINSNLRFIVEELDQLTKKEQREIDIKKQVLGDLKHLEKVVAEKIREIEAKIEQL